MNLFMRGGRDAVPHEGIIERQGEDRKLKVQS